MKTVVTESPKVTSEFIRKNDIVAFPTETVYGLGASVFSERAIEKIFEVKKRPLDNPLIVHISSISQIDYLSSQLSKTAELLIKRFFPSALTVIVKKSSSISNLVSSGLDTIGIRMPNHPLALDFIRLSKCPIAAPSANLSGKPSATRWQDVLTDLNNCIPCVLKDNLNACLGIESTVVDCTTDPPTLLRFGSLPMKTLQTVCPTIALPRSDNHQPKSPGTKYKHYSPNAFVHIVKKIDALIIEKHDAFIGTQKPNTNFEKNILICNNTEEYAQNLFAFFRDSDAKGVKNIYCQEVPLDGVGNALMDRLKKASSH